MRGNNKLSLDDDPKKQTKNIKMKFKTFVCFSKKDEEKAHILESVLAEKGYGTYLIDVESHGDFISSEIKDSIRLCVCSIMIFTSNLLDSRLVNQEIGYVQGKGSRVIFMIHTKLKEEFRDIDKKITIVEFNEENFRQQCLSVSDNVTKIVEIMDEPVDFEAFLDFYTKNNSPSKTKL